MPARRSELANGWEFSPRSDVFSTGAILIFFCWRFSTEDVEKVDPDLVVRDKEGKPYSVRYEQVNAMLLNEFLKEHRKMEEQQAIIGQLNSNAAKQEARITRQQEQIDALTAGFQRISAQIESSKWVVQAVVHNPEKAISTASYFGLHRQFR